MCKDLNPAGAPEITPKMIEAGVAAYYQTAVWGWDNPGTAELSAVLACVFAAMAEVANKE